jgi:hypothetical protein
MAHLDLPDCIVHSMLGDLFVYCEHVMLKHGWDPLYLAQKSLHCYSLLPEQCIGRQRTRPGYVWKIPMLKVDVDIKLTNALSLPDLTRF